MLGLGPRLYAHPGSHGPIMSWLRWADDMAGVLSMDVLTWGILFLFLEGDASRPFFPCGIVGNEPKDVGTKSSLTICFRF